MLYASVTGKKLSKSDKDTYRRAGLTPSKHMIYILVTSFKPSFITFNAETTLLVYANLTIAVDKNVYKYIFSKRFNAGGKIEIHRKREMRRTRSKSCKQRKKKTIL